MFPFRSRSLLSLASLILLTAAACAPRPASAEKGIYKQTNLVSDIPGLALHTDPDLVNPWGISFGPTTPFWVSDNGTGKTTLYDGDGDKQGLIVTIPPPAGSPAGTVSAPTGQVFNGSGDFVVSAGGKKGPARFIFATEDGTISGWNPGVKLNDAILAVDQSGMGSVFKGLAIASTVNGNRLFASDFHNGVVAIYDASYKLVGTWMDPFLPKGFAPFNVQLINNVLVVTFAKQDDIAHDDVAGPGNGAIDLVDPNTGRFVRFATGKAARIVDGDGDEGLHRGGGRELNSPWGVVLAPASFGRFGGALLVGNFGDGRISAFNPRNGQFLGQLQDAEEHPISIDGLWALKFGNGGTDFKAGTLYFTAGLDGEQHGLFGTLDPVMMPDDD